MAQSWRHWRWQLGLASSLATGGALASLENCALAQISPDTTLGREKSTVTSTGSVDQINGGAARGPNLFHSFQEFNVGNGRSAYFTNPVGIENILSRVTGANPSNILGTLGVSGGNANLFLINPKGILFGPNARLDVGGSFMGTTANTVQFGNQGFFSASAPNVLSLLTINPSAFLFNQIAAQPIRNQSYFGLGVPAGRSFLLLGGDVRLEEGFFDLGGAIYAPGSRVELGGLAGAGTVGLNTEGNSLRLSFPENVARADVSLVNEAFTDVAAGDSGSIVVNARNLSLTGGSFLQAGIGSGLGSTDSQVGDIGIDATEAVTVSESDIFNNVQPGAVGNGGNINITAGSLLATNGSRLDAGTSGQGNGGSVNINARNKVIFDGEGSNELPTAALSNVEIGAEGNAGDVNITAGSLEVKNGALLESRTRGEGDARSVNINVRDQVLFDGIGSFGWVSGAYSSVEDTAIGNGGDINITTGSLEVKNGALLQALTRGEGNGGSVNINARNKVIFYGVSSNGFQSGASSRAESGVIGDAGDISITTGSLEVKNGALLQTNTFKQGNAGSININARNKVIFDGVGGINELSTAVFSSVEDKAVGNAGDINITTGSLEVKNGAQLQALTRGKGNAANVNINARNKVIFDGMGSNGYSSAAFSSVESTSVGKVKGGTINIITTGLLSVTNDALLSTSSAGSGAAGNIEVEASSIRLDNQAHLSSDTTGGQGNIILGSEDLVLRRGSNITTDARGTATGGNITIKTGVLAALENSDIRANAGEGPGGRVRIKAKGIFGTEFRSDETLQSDITASSDLGPQFSGTVELNTPDVDPTSGLVALPEEVVDVSGLVTQRCSAGGGNVASRASEFVVTGRGGLPPGPSDPPSSDAVLADWITFDSKMEKSRSSSAPSTHQANPAPAPLVEAQGWMRDSKGQVVLTAQAPQATPYSPGLKTASCPGS